MIIVLVDIDALKRNLHQQRRPNSGHILCQDGPSTTERITQSLQRNPHSWEMTSQRCYEKEMLKFPNHFLPHSDDYRFRFSRLHRFPMFHMTITTRFQRSKLIQDQERERMMPLKRGGPRGKFSHGFGINFPSSKLPERRGRLSFLILPDP